MVNYERPVQAPLSLQSKTNYRKADVIASLRQMFHDKCYLCETKSPSTINVEHFKPSTRYSEKEFEWTNLFFACGHCNGTKLAKPQFDDILDCTDSNTPVDKWIKYEMKPFPKEKIIFTAMEQSQIVANTIELLDAIYNGVTPIRSAESEYICNKLLWEIVHFQEALLKYDLETEPPHKRTEHKQFIETNLKRSAPFSAFKRWIVLSNHFLSQEFSQHID